MKTLVESNMCGALRWPFSRGDLALEWPWHHRNCRAPIEIILHNIRNVLSVESYGVCSLMKWKHLDKLQLKIRMFSTSIQTAISRHQVLLKYLMFTPKQVAQFDDWVFKYFFNILSSTQHSKSEEFKMQISIKTESEQSLWWIISSLLNSTS